MTKKVFQKFAKRYSDSNIRLCIEDIYAHSPIFGDKRSVHSHVYTFDLENDLFTVTGTMSNFTKNLYNTNLYPESFWDDWKEKFCKTYTVHRKYINTMYRVED